MYNNRVVIGIEGRHIKTFLMISFFFNPRLRGSLSWYLYLYILGSFTNLQLVPEQLQQQPMDHKSMQKL